MKQLDPKAFWLFFISNLVRFGILAAIIGFWRFQTKAYSVISNINFGDGTLQDAEEILNYNWSGFVLLAALIVAILSFAIAKLTYHYYRYEMTDIVFKKEHGIIWKKYVSIPYDRIQNVDIYRGVFARLLGLSDIQIQTAGGITAGSYGAFSEGRLLGVSKEEAEKLRDELIQRARNSRTGQGL